jgi:hypothetical protein
MGIDAFIAQRADELTLKFGPGFALTAEVKDAIRRGTSRCIEHCLASPGEQPARRLAGFFSFKSALFRRGMVIVCYALMSRRSAPTEPASAISPVQACKCYIIW